MDHVNACIDGHLSRFEKDPLTEAMRHAVSGGKRIRARLVVLSSRLYGVPEAQAAHVACAAECLHGYSLVHDDLPAMDNDDLRRGKPTVHVAWNEAVAILAGDALQSLAFEILADSRVSPDPGIRVSLIASLAEAAGAAGMALGQSLDMAAQSSDSPTSLDETMRMQSKKTGALIRWCAEAGPRLQGEDTRIMREFGEALGLLFQMTDDILDMEGDSQEAGKRLRKDAAARKSTLVSGLGLDQAKAMARDTAEKATGCLEAFGAKADSLRELVGFVTSRGK